MTDKHELEDVDSKRERKQSYASNMNERSITKAMDIVKKKRSRALPYKMSSVNIIDFSSNQDMSVSSLHEDNPG